MKFIDLFSGLGGFHTGLSNNGFECVFASEIDSELSKLYKKNYGIEPHGDITKIDHKNIPKHDILCAGFPCQPFSLAGQKKGAKCPTSGKLIDDVIRIANYHKPKYILLENVPNILTIENGKFWEYIKHSFDDIGYSLSYKIISPMDIGIPQNRKRIFIIGTQKSNTKEINWNLPSCNHKVSLINILEPNLPHKKLEPQKAQLLNLWQELLNNIAINELGSTSIVAPEFGANYPLELDKLTLQEIKKYKGAYGSSLKNCKTWDDVFRNLPNYIKNKNGAPNWIKKSILFSRNLYQNNTHYLDQWKTRINKDNNSWQILEWRGNKTNLILNNHIIQFRASGIRVLKSDKAPSLIAMTPTQTPIIANEARYISKYEAAKLQHLHKINLPENNTRAFKALGNAVNAKVVELIGKSIKETVIH